MRVSGSKTVGIASFVVVSFSAAARAADETPREKELETRVQDLERRLEEVLRQQRSGANAAGDELEARVAELEKLTKKGEEGLFPYWKNGFRMDSASGATKVRLGGFIQNDWSFFAENQDFEDHFGREIEAGTQFRRARLMAEGSIYGNVDYKAEFDFAGGAANFRNVWMALRGLPLGTLTVGNMKQPFGLEELTPDLFVSFMERSAPSTAFAPAYDTGFQLANAFAEDRFVWQVGVFRESNAFGDDAGNSESGEYNGSARVAGRPWIGEDKNDFLHLGGAVLTREPANDTLQFRSTPELNLAGIFVDTGAITSRKAWVLEGEAAFQTGPFTVIGEYYRADVTSDTAGDPTFDGWSLEGSFFLTEDRRGYDAGKATFSRVIPKKNWDGKGGSGAWQLVGRIDGIDLTDEGVDGGEMKIASFGVNWYANPNTKIMAAVVRPDLDGVGKMWGFEMRFQVDF
jgi:phosphate-selective porin OprO/OprP